MNKPSTIQCCVSDCTKFGTHLDSEGNLYCTDCWREKFANEEMTSEGGNECDEGCESCPKRKCDVPGCKEEGIVRERSTGKLFCAKFHAWKSDRPEDKGDGGLTHPQKAEWNDQDAIRAAGLGINLGIKIGEC